MELTTVETKNGGKIDVVVYSSPEDATKEIGRDKVLSLINRMTRVDSVNLANRKQSDAAKLKAAMKTNPEIAKAFQELLKKYEIADRKEVENEV